LLLLLEIYNAITLRKKAVAAEAVKLPPGAAAGMAVGPQIGQSESARNSHKRCGGKSAARCPLYGDGGLWAARAR
jgi:cytochrome c5